MPETPQVLSCVSDALLLCGAGRCAWVSSWLGLVQPRLRPGRGSGRVPTLSAYRDHCTSGLSAGVGRLWGYGADGTAACLDPSYPRPSCFLSKSDTPLLYTCNDKLCLLSPVTSPTGRCPRCHHVQALPSRVHDRGACPPCSTLHNGRRRLLIVLLYTRVQQRHCIKTGVCVWAQTDQLNVTRPRADRAGVYADAATLLWFQHV